MNETETRGRKKTNIQPASKKQAQVRAAQRAFQDRKRLHVERLERRVQELEAENAALRLANESGNAPTFCANCLAPIHAVPIQPSLEQMLGSNLLQSPLASDNMPYAFNHVVGMDSELETSFMSNPLLKSASAELSVFSLSSPESVTHTLTTSNPDDWLEQDSNGINERQTRDSTNKSAVEMFGPVHTEFARYILNTIPSLRNSSYACQLLDLFEEQASYRDKAKVQRSMIIFMQIWAKMMEHCTDPAERRIIYEVDEIFHEVNRDHMTDPSVGQNLQRYYYALGAKAAEKFAKSQTASVLKHTAESETLRRTLHLIPSFQNAGNLIDELCVVYFQSSDPKWSFFRAGVLFEKLQDMCTTSEDRATFLAVLDNLKFQDLDRLHEAVSEMALEDK
ncbi:hypothetical protein HDU78_010588 [Chytriomyces hyalinus]|nr:hypothetical protein HDU78_010588 [Chytriomyces hyalinus]